MEEAAAKGQGAAAFEGRLIDIASIRQAEALVAKGGPDPLGHVAVECS